MSARRYPVELSAQEIAGLLDVLVNSSLADADDDLEHRWYFHLRDKFQVLYHHTQELEPRFCKKHVEEHYGGYLGQDCSTENT